jgi:hypothetical protein
LFPGLWPEGPTQASPGQSAAAIAAQRRPGSDVHGVACPEGAEQRRGRPTTVKLGAQWGLLFCPFRAIPFVLSIPRAALCGYRRVALPWAGLLLPPWGERHLDRNTSRAWELVFVLLALAVSVGAGAVARAADDDDPNNDRRIAISEQQFEYLLKRTPITIEVIDGERRMSIPQSARKEMDAELTSEIETIVRECSLTETQKKKLQLAGRGDIAQILDRVTDLRGRYVAVPLDFEQVQNELHMLCNISQFCTLQEASLFRKTLRKLLNDEQLVQFQLLEHKRKVALVESALGIWSRASNRVDLKGEARQRFIDTLVTHGDIPPTPNPYAQYIVLFEAARLETPMTPLLTESEWQTMEPVLKVARKLEPNLRKSGQWPLPRTVDEGDRSNTTKDDVSPGDKP